MTTAITTAADLTLMAQNASLVVVTERERLDRRTLVRGVCTPGVSDAELLERSVPVSGSLEPPKVERSAMLAANNRTIRHLQAFVVIIYTGGSSP